MAKRKTVGQKLRQIVADSGRSDLDLADAAGMHGTSVWRLRQGIGNPQLAAAEKLARVVGFSLELVPVKKTRKKAKRKR